MADIFDSAWLKFGWAHRHGSRLMEETERFFQGDRVFQEKIRYDNEAGELVLSVASVEPVPSIISLTLADALGCFRQCLDHVAWEMVQRGNGRSSNTHFVIADHPNDFANQMVSNMPGITSADYAIVKELHDHMWSADDPPGSAIVRMRMLNNRDKHQFIPVVNARPRTLNFYEMHFQDCTSAGPFRAVGDPELVAGFEFSRIPIKKTGPNPTMYSTGRIQTVQSIDGVSVVDLLNTLEETIIDLVLSRVQPVPPQEIYTLSTNLKPPASS